MVSTHCHFSQKAAYSRARASSYCIYRFFNVARYAIPVARYAIRVARDAIRVLREGRNLHLGGPVCTDKQRAAYPSVSKIFKEGRSNPSNQLLTNLSPKPWPNSGRSGHPFQSDNSAVQFMLRVVLNVE